MKAKPFCIWFLRCQKVGELRGGRLKRRNGDFALIAAHPKLRIGNRGVKKGLSSPMQSMAKGALNVHLPKAVSHPGRIKGLAGNRKLEVIYYLVK